MLDKLSAPRRALDFEDYIDIVRRNVRWLIGPTFAGLVIATVVVFSLEDTFVSAARLKITPQQVPEVFVQSVVNQQLADRINSMATNIESRAQLTGIIDRFGLYKRELAKEPVEDVLNKMRGSIGIFPTGTVSAVGGHAYPTFLVTFAYRDRYKARDVCQYLVTQFMDENNRQVTEDVNGTEDFLVEEFKTAKRDLDGLETKLAQFRTENAGRLPEEVESNLSQMNGLNGRMGALNAERNRIAQERMMINSQLDIQRNRLRSLKELSSQVSARNERILDLDRQIAGAENNIATLKERYKDTYPDLQSARAQLDLLKRQREQALKDEQANEAKEATHPEPVVESPQVRREREEIESTMQQLKTQLRARDLEESEYSKEERQISGALGSVQQRLEGLPTGEKQYEELIRDRDLAKARYQEAQIKLERSQAAKRLQELKKGESLELLDPANLPDNPTAPKRPMYLGLGVFAGFVLGVIIVAIREVKDTALKSLKDARLGTQLTILGSVPLLENDAVVQRRRQIMWVGWATATLVGLAVMAGSVAHYYLNRT